MIKKYLGDDGIDWDSSDTWLLIESERELYWDGCCGDRECILCYKPMGYPRPYSSARVIAIIEKIKD